MSAHNGSHRSIVVSSLFGFGFLVGLVQTTGLSILSSLQYVNLTQALDENLSHSYRPFLESHYELEEDVG